MLSAAVLGDPAARAGAGGRHRHERQDHHHATSSTPRCARAGQKVGLARHRAVPHRRPAGRGGAHDARVLGPAGPVPRDGGRRLQPRGARGLLALAGAEARARLRVPGGRLHQPHARPPGLPRRHGGATSRPSGCCSTRCCGRTDTPSSTPTTTARTSWSAASRGRVWTYALAATRPTSRPRTIALSLGGTRFRARTPAGAFEVTTPLLGRFNVQNLLAALGAGLALGVARGRARAASAPLARRARPAGARGGRPGLHRGRGLRPHRRRAQEPAGDRARAAAAPGHHRLRLRRRPRPHASGRSWARWRRASPTW